MEHSVGAGPRAAERGSSEDAEGDVTEFDRVRRPTDLLLALFALGLLLFAVVLFHGLPTGSSELSNDISHALIRIPRWLSFGVSAIASLGAVVLSILILGALIRREAPGAVNAGVAAGLAAIAAVAVSAIWQSEHGTLSRLVFAGRNPSIFIIDSTFLAFLTATDLVRRPRWRRWCVLSAVVLVAADVVGRSVAPLGATVVVLGGLACGWIVRWLLGAASLRPSLQRIEAEVGGYGIDVSSVRQVAPSKRAKLVGRLADGGSVELRLANRDTRGAGALRALWSLVRLRGSVAGHPTLSSRGELERVALAGYIAAGAGVLAPRVLLLIEMTGESMVLVTRMPEGKQVDESLDLDSATALFRALRDLHGSGVAHRNLRRDHLLVADKNAGFGSLDEALPAASALVRRLDVAQLLTTLGRLVGAPGAVKAMRDGYQPANEELIAASLQPVALAPWGFAAMREARGCVGELRKELVGTDELLPAERIERFHWRTVLSAAALTIAAYLIVGQLSKVNLLSALRETNLGWFAVALSGSAITYIAAAENLAAFVPKRLSPVRGFFVQLSTAFVGVALPPTVGHIAVNARYLQRQHVDESAVAAAVTLSQIANVFTTIILLLVIGLLTGSGISRFKIAPSTKVLVGIAVAAGLVGVLLLVPKTRSMITHRVWPRLYSVWPRLLEAVSQPLRLAAGMGTDLLLTAAYVLAFVASIISLGGHAPLLPVAAVFLAGNTVGSVVPTPGGLGAVETVLAAGLTALGIPAHVAIPAVLIFRVATFWLPIPAGWISYRVLQRKGIL